MDRPMTVRVLENKQEARDIKTLKLGYRVNAKPGQFVMLWLPGVGEKPFSLSRIGKNSEITYDVKGKFTKALFGLKKEDVVGVRGPYGNGWNISRAKRICAVCGGIGMASVMPLVEENKVKTVIYGARNRDLLVFGGRLRKAGVETIYTTDDGSFGRKCYACDVLEEVLAEGRYDLVLTCGPERLMKRVVDICLGSNTPCQASLERYMKCGIGICGACAIEPVGLCVCKDGPVFDAAVLKKSEFGRYRRDKTGGKESA